MFGFRAAFLPISHNQTGNCVHVPDESTLRAATSFEVGSRQFDARPWSTHAEQRFYPMCGGQLSTVDDVDYGRWYVPGAHNTDYQQHCRQHQLQHTLPFVNHQSIDGATLDDFRSHLHPLRSHFHDSQHRNLADQHAYANYHSAVGVTSANDDGVKYRHELNLGAQVSDEISCDPVEELLASNNNQRQQDTIGLQFAYDDSTQFTYY